MRTALTQGHPFVQGLPYPTMRASWQDQEEDASLERARSSLGEQARNLSDSELSGRLAEVQHLMEAWADEYERLVLDGSTLTELLRI